VHANSIISDQPHSALKTPVPSWHGQQEGQLSIHKFSFSENFPSQKIITEKAVTLNNASDYRANGLLSDYIGWTNGLTN